MAITTATPAATGINFLPELFKVHQASKHHLKFLPATAQEILEYTIMEEFK
jgi:hypothetical protein